MTPRSISARVVGLATGLLLLISAVAAPPALANSLCNNGGPGVAGTADIALVQSVSALADGNYLDHLNITNYGPCSVPNVGLTVTLPGAFVKARSNPSSWTCNASVTVTCFETSTIGVPGTADIYLEYAPAAGLISACAATFGTVAQLATCPNSGGSPADPNPDPHSNTSTVAAGVLTSDGTLVYGLTQADPTPTIAFNHTTSIKLKTGGLVNIYQSSTDPTYCPANVTDCFLGTITINFTNVSGAKTWTLEFLPAELSVKKSLSQITIWNSVGGGGFTALSNCSGKNATDPCVQSRSRSTNVEGATVYTIVVVGTHDNGMTAD
jgi:hypothetical protein